MIPNVENPTYLGIKIDRALTFKKHLEDHANYFENRENNPNTNTMTTDACGHYFTRLTKTNTV